MYGRRGITTYQLLIGESRVESTCAVKVRRRCTPGSGIGVAARDICRNAAPREEPNADMTRSPLGGIDTTFNSIESVSIGRRIAVNNVRDSVGLTRGSFIGILVSLRRVGAAVDGDPAAGTGVEGLLIRRLQADTLDDVDFATVGPGLGSADGPVCRPNAAGIARHVCDVCNEQAQLPALVAGHSNTVAPSPGSDVLRIHSQVDLVVVRVDDASRLSGGLAHVVDIATGGIRIL